MEKKTATLPKEALNQWVKFLNDSDFLALVNKQRIFLSNIPSSKPTNEFQLSCAKLIQSYLTKKKIPAVWIQPIYKFIVKDPFLDFPLHNSISLKVGSQEVTASTRELIKIKSIKTGEVQDDKTVSLVISAKVSVEQIIQFVKDNKNDIEILQDFYELPKYKNPIFKNIQLALDITKMKDLKGMTFTEISSELSNKEDLTSKQLDYLASTDNIKTLYYRFKRYLQS